MSAPSAEGKLARYLLSFGDKELTLSATQLGRRLGVGRATLYRAFEALERAGTISREGKTIRILQPEALRNVLNETRKEALP